MKIPRSFLRPAAPALLALAFTTFLLPGVHAQVKVGSTNYGSSLLLNNNTLNTAAYTIVGETSTASLTLLNHAHFNTTSILVLGLQGSGTGIVSVSGGSTVSSGLDTQVGWQGTGALTVDGAGSSLQVLNGGLFSGWQGTGYINVTNGGNLTANGWATLADQTGSHGNLTVDGAGSLFNLTGGMTLGRVGVGTMNVQNGGAFQETSGSLSVGSVNGATGTLTVTGAGSTATLGGETYIGSAGQGTLLVQNGGAFRSVGYLGVGQEAGGLGSVSVQSGGTLIANQELHVGEGHLGNSQGALVATGSGSHVQVDHGLIIGQWGNGTLSVQNGATVSAGDHFDLAAQTGSTGLAVVDGAGSALAVTGNAYLGGQGTAALTVQHGGGFHATGWSALGIDGSGAMTVRSGGTAAFDADLVLGSNVTGQGTLTVDGTGSSVLAGGGYFGVGQQGQGTLSVTNGGSLLGNAWVSVGNDPGSTGALNLAGPGSLLTARGLAAAAGAGGTGNVTISAGAEAHLSEWLVANGGGANRIDVLSGGKVETGLGISLGGPGHGVLRVDGAGSSAVAHLNVDVGWAGSAQLDVTNGGSVHTDHLFSTGVSHSGVSNISGGATVTAGDAIYVGGSAGANGVLNLSGAGTTAAAPYVGIGYLASGELNLLDQATVTADTVNVAWGKLTVDGGTLNASAITIRQDGALDYNRTGAAAGAIHAATLDNAGLFAINTAAPVAAIPDSRTLGAAVHNAATGAVHVNLQDNAAVTFTGAVVNDGLFKVTQAPGTSGGVTTFTSTFTNNGSFIQDPTTTHFAELFNAGYFSASDGDQVLVDAGFHNDGHLSLTRSLLSTDAGLTNDGVVDIFNGAEILGDYSGTGALIFHISSLADQLVFHDGFSGSLELVFDPGYLLLGTEHFLSFGQGAYLSSLMIGGISFGAMDFSGPGHLLGNGSFVASSVPDSAGTLGLFVLALGLLLPLRRRLAAC